MSAQSADPPRLLPAGGGFSLAVENPVRVGIYRAGVYTGMIATDLQVAVAELDGEPVDERDPRVARLLARATELAQWSREGLWPPAPEA